MIKKYFLIAGFWTLWVLQGFRGLGPLGLGFRIKVIKGLGLKV